MRGGGRSHRLPEPDEWVDGSWTVDCVCGVNYDDGEEMVSCDECGIWVHTRCSRFVKGETSFACDKCKSKKTRKENEETEVAQLLVELPTKTLKMESFSSGRPFRRLWTDIPMEERVHVQGVPGGDPAVFQGLSSVFNPQLWKCTGYVPKKFYFQYREFPCWDEKPGGDSVQVVGSHLPADEAKVEEENENAVDRGADVLFSLSKEISPYTPPMGGRIDMRSSADGVRHDHEWGVSEVKERESKGLGGKHGLHSGKRERNQLRPHGLHSGKKRKEESRGSKDCSGKKKAKSVDRGDEAKKRSSSVEKVHLSKRFTATTDMRKLDFHGDGGLEVASTDYQDFKNEATPPEPDFDGDHGFHEDQDNDNRPKHVIVVRTLSAGISNEWDRHRAALETETRTEKDPKAPVKDENSPRNESSLEAVAETDDVPRVSIKEEDAETAVDGLNLLKGEIHCLGELAGCSSSVAVDPQRSKPPMGELMGIVPVLPDTHIPQESDHKSPTTCKKEVQDDHVTGESVSLSSSVSHRKGDVDKRLPQHSNTLGISGAHLSEPFIGHATSINGLPSGEHISQDAEAVSICDGNNIAEEILSRSNDVQLSGRESEEVITLLAMHEGSAQSKHSGKLAARPSKSGGKDPSPPAPKVRKLVVGSSTSKSSSGSIKLSISSSHKRSGSPASPTTAKPHFSKHRVKSNPSTDGKKDEATMDIWKEEEFLETQRVQIKERNKGSVNSGPKMSHTSRVMHASASKHALSDSKEQVFSPPSKATLSSHNAVISSGSGDSPSLSQSQIASSAQNKQTALGSCQKSDKIIQSSPQPSSKGSNHSPLVHLPAPVSASAALSDEELALLLHQELNSSPRVPRVPRVRQAGGLPQLASSTPSSMLVKRSSVSVSPSTSVGLKDQILVLKRKSKEDTRDSTRNSREAMDDTQKANISPSSPDHRRQDPIFKTDDSIRKNFEYRSADLFVSGKKNTSFTTTTGESSFHASYVKANDQNQSFACNSTGDLADDANANVSANAQTLPGLIDEIISKGRQTCFEEICDAVLPHWQNLRKHNGERYAYSSHSQAVLDCLRNRNEWAHLIDRGPKTNLSRKRRKVDTDRPVIESDSEDFEGRGASNMGEGKSAESHREDVPKGKRNARKGRRLMLHGRVTGEIRKRKKDASLTDDDDTGPFSHSSDSSESVSSENDSPGATTGGVGSETSSSDETG